MRVGRITRDIVPILDSIARLLRMGSHGSFKNLPPITLFKTTGLPPSGSPPRGGCAPGFGAMLSFDL
jgi:hypothetical protein